MSIRLRIDWGSKETGWLLEAYLIRHGLKISGPTDISDAFVCYGKGYTGDKPALNGKLTRYDKQQAIRKFQELQIPTVQIMDRYNAMFPCFGRKAARAERAGGREIIPVFDKKGLEYALAAGSDFFTKYIPNVMEGRVWIYRRQPLIAYEKTLDVPHEYNGLGRNHTNGFKFHAWEAPPEALEIAARAVDALELDFGAVDLLEAEDVANGRWRVLEVNTAPGVSNGDRRDLDALCAKIARWAELGYPNRRANVNAA